MLVMTDNLLGSCGKAPYMEVIMHCISFAGVPFSATVSCIISALACSLVPRLCFPTRPGNEANWHAPGKQHPNMQCAK